MQSFNIVNTPIISLFSRKWIPGLAAEDNNWFSMWPKEFTHNICIFYQD